MNLADIALRLGRDPTRADHPAFHTADGAVSNAEFQKLVATFAVSLATRVKPGDRVVFRMTNTVEFAAAFLACIWLGAIPVLQNSQLGRSELEHVVRLSDPVLFLLAEHMRDDPATEGLKPGTGRLIVTREGLAGETAASATSLPAAFDAGRDTPAFIVFTSGTTGKPKGVVHAHRWLEALGDSNRARVPAQPGDVILATGEWSFISALGHNVMFPLRNGTTGSVMEDRASPERILQTIERDRVTLLHSVATLYRRILGTPGIEHRYDLTSLRGANSTGEPLEDAVRKEWQARFGCPIWEHYGISEAQMVIGDGPNIAKKEGSTGKTWGARALVVDEQLAPLAANEPGTLAFGADYPGFFLGYLGDDRQTKATLRGGLFVTSDLARIDGDGYVFIMGRADDCFKSKGVLIAPRELEEAILSLGQFEEACVFPIPDREIGHKIGVAVVPRPTAQQGLADKLALSNALMGRIAPFKMPHQVFVLDRLPKNANGKTQRSEVARVTLQSASAS
ncbi:acyl-CoA synthetase [Rhodoplanes sp. Z2-YC6860]|uniref:acyl-CoA synthetase n=1 Tax=Rhodoplanes sp. Z2-YC6860 TaxID=674703 RepID=UPI00078B686A|nr:class I adenylate-forming enzyme family protein [Rhodoplanes sp. Z2-YC6860]AMN40750.1 AMP-dependent synthetase and ligase [Rhodoplanes sp. Z2-YC6860]